MREKFTPARIGSTGAQSPASVLRLFVTIEPLLAPPETIQQSVKIFFKKYLDRNLFVSIV